MPHCHMFLIGLLSAAGLLSAPAAGAATLQDATNAVLQADGPRALALFRAMQPANPAEGRKRDCAVARLQGRPSFPSPLIAGHPLPDAVLRAYRDYWRNAMTPARRVAAEQALFGQLRRLTGQPASTPPDDVLDALSSRLEALGLHSTLGLTAGLYDLLLYFREDERTYPVLLPDGHRETVRVFLMRDVVSPGWAKHLNCGAPGTGGFATDKGLYAFADSYDLDDESFRVNFLAHETQHYADYKRLPGLEGPELEFRAKLTEMALAEATQRTYLQNFQANQSDDRDNPHGWANKRVLAALAAHLNLNTSAALADVEPDTLRAAARTLLLRDNMARDVAPPAP